MYKSSFCLCQHSTVNFVNLTLNYSSFASGGLQHRPKVPFRRYRGILRQWFARIVPKCFCLQSTRLNSRWTARKKRNSGWWRGGRWVSRTCSFKWVVTDWWMPAHLSIGTIIWASSNKKVQLIQFLDIFQEYEHSQWWSLIQLDSSGSVLLNKTIATQVFNKLWQYTLKPECGHDGHDIEDPWTSSPPISNLRLH